MPGVKIKRKKFIVCQQNFQVMVMILASCRILLGWVMDSWIGHFGRLDQPCPTSHSLMLLILPRPRLQTFKGSGSKQSTSNGQKAISIPIHLQQAPQAGGCANDLLIYWLSTEVYIDSYWLLLTSNDYLPSLYWLLLTPFWLSTDSSIWYIW